MVTYYKDKNLPNRFKECRRTMKLTQPQLSSLLGFKGGKATIMSYEKLKIDVEYPPELLPYSL